MTEPFEHLPLTTDGAEALLVGRLLDPEVGPCVVAVRGTELVDLSGTTPTVSDLLDRQDRLGVVRGSDGGRRWSLPAVLAATLDGDRTGPRLLAPVDLQVIKAAGVTFARSMLERVIEEHAKGDPARAREIRARVADVVGGAVASVRPGSEEAARAKTVLIAEGLWSPYLEVGIGPDPEIFSKAPVLSAVGTGAQIGVLERSTWNNPEPEVVLAVTSTGEPVGATLGNDVNLRDFEGRSALLLTEAKDNNASCAIGPMIRLFDDTFTLDDVRRLDVTLRIEGRDGYVLEAGSSMSEMSRDPLDLVRHAHGRHHQYPDGFALFTGTMFAPVDDRDEPGLGFTHHPGDRVTISAPALGRLVNMVTSSEQAPPWTSGIRELMRNLAARDLL
ncbi:fumarylacetoacetate hydrolase family protein [Microlunatus antarcticus]|uniref:Fumarylacetoacetate (FAA) hydrolase family protein n=1 Tax=Microlunatus antarcticus TaxID=53388 RepID=A0A7W5P6N5_9ACTN|nr:fumarylacetoacetate hydrolase family protein [Microlunatus antarcticus]MBB3326618.1 fumarylacetoacetate (FAA) hydrolase family protein [Microlunatus antarcticus]